MNTMKIDIKKIITGIIIIAAIILGIAIGLGNRPVAANNPASLQPAQTEMNLGQANMVDQSELSLKDGR